MLRRRRRRRRKSRSNKKKTPMVSTHSRQVYDTSSAPAGGRERGKNRNAPAKEVEATTIIIIKKKNSLLLSLALSFRREKEGGRTSPEKVDGERVAESRLLSAPVSQKVCASRVCVCAVHRKSCGKHKNSSTWRICSEIFFQSVL